MTKPGDRFFQSEEFYIHTDITPDGERVKFEFNMHTLSFELHPLDAIRFAHQILDEVTKTQHIQSGKGADKNGKH